DRNQQLRRQVLSLEAQLGTVTALQNKVAEFETLFNLRSTLLQNMQTTGANVIANGVSNFEGSITIDKGSGDGLKVNDPIVAGGGARHPGRAAEGRRRPARGGARAAPRRAGSVGPAAEAAAAGGRGALAALALTVDGSGRQSRSSTARCEEALARARRELMCH